MFIFQICSFRGELTDKEYRLVRKYLMDWRNKLTAQGRDAGPVNELLIKLMA